MQTIHLFYLWSNFHLMIIESYMATNGISHNDVFFITHRGIRLPDKYKDRLLYDGTITPFKARTVLYKRNAKKYNELLAHKRVFSYAPFQFVFPSCRYFTEYNLIEEGFSAYTLASKRSNIKDLLCEWVKCFYINLLFPFASRSIKGFLMGISYSSKRTRKQCNLFVSSSDAYSNYNLGNRVKKVVVPIIKSEFDAGIGNQYILVLDRLSKKGRPFDDVKYLNVLETVLDKLKLKKSPLLIKLHPSDSCSAVDVKSRLETVFSELEIEYSYIDENLEEIARSNKGNTFIGTNSTILYYAPILGTSNQSISFARQLASVDIKYSEFLEGWGGTEKFCEIFSKQVICL